MARLIPETFVAKNGLELNFRSEEPSDWQQLVTFMNHVKRESTFTYQFPEQPEYTEQVMRDRLKSFLESPRKMQVGAFLKDRLIASVDWQSFHHNEAHPWVKHNALFGMTVIKEFWGLGIAFRMLQIMEREARAMEYRQIFAEVRSNNEAGLSLYGKFGFEITGRRKDMAFINEKYFDDFIICKKIY